MIWVPPPAALSTEQRAPERRRPIAHVRQPEMTLTAASPTVEPAPVVADLELQVRRRPREPDGRLGRAGVAGHVGQCLAGDLQELGANVRRRLVEPLGQVQAHLDQAVLVELLGQGDQEADEVGPVDELGSQPEDEVRGGPGSCRAARRSRDPRGPEPRPGPRP